MGFSQGWEFFIFTQIFRADVLKVFRTVLYIFWNFRVLYFLRWFFIFFQVLNEMKGTYMNNKKNSGCFRPFYCPVCSFWKVSNLEKKFSRSLSPEISMLRRSLKVNLFFKSRILRAGSLFFSKIWGLVLYTTVLYRTTRNQALRACI